MTPIQAILVIIIFMFMVAIFTAICIWIILKELDKRGWYL